MKALTLHGVNAWCVMYAGKHVENRSWRPSLDLVGQRIAIHAGEKPGDADWRETIRTEHPAAPSDFPKAVIVGTVRIKGFIWRGEELGDGAAQWVGLTEAEARAVNASRWVSANASNWWVLADPRPVRNPIPCKGKLGLWNVPDALAAALSEASKSQKPPADVTPKKAQGAAKKLPKSEPAPEANTTKPRSIDEISDAELLDAICSIASAAPANESELLRATSRHLGFSRMGSRVEQKLQAQLRKAVETRVLAQDERGVRKLRSQAG